VKKLILFEFSRAVIFPMCLSEKAFIDYAIVSHTRTESTTTLTPDDKHE